MEISQTQERDVVVVRPVGRLDANTSLGLEEKLLGLIDKREKKIVVDFSQLDFISSAGWRVFLIAAKQLKTVNGKISFCSLKENVREVFDIAGFTSIFSTYTSQEEAVNAL